MDTSGVIINTLDGIYNIGSLASLGYNGVTVASIYRSAASSPFIPQFVEIAKVISLIVCVVLGVFIFRVQQKLRRLNAGTPPPAPVSTGQFEEAAEPTARIPAPASGGWLTARWGEIMRHMESAKESEWRFAIIEADKLVDEVLKRAGYPGNMLGERLMNMQPGQLETLETLWDAHKARNRVAHDMNYFLRYTEAKQVIAKFEATLHELRAI